jgi:hypothetical protein
VCRICWTLSATLLECLPCVMFPSFCWRFQFFADHAAELHYYVQPLVVEEPPQQLSTGEYVAKLEAGDSGVPDVTRSLSEEAADFLASAAPADRLLLLLGEAGSGKSMFTWLTARRLLDEYDVCVAALLDAAVTTAGASSGASEGAVPASVLWVPLVVDLKNYKMSELRGLLPRYLMEACNLSEPAVLDLRRSVPFPGLTGVVPRLLLLCDGFDELQAEGDEAATKLARGALENIVAVLCGGPDSAWPHDALKVVVTCRESRLAGRSDESKVFGKHRRRILLPFNTKQVGLTPHAVCFSRCLFLCAPLTRCQKPGASCKAASLSAASLSTVSCCTVVSACLPPEPVPCAVVSHVHRFARILMTDGPVAADSRPLLLAVTTALPSLYFPLRSTWQSCVHRRRYLR